MKGEAEAIDDLIKEKFGNGTDDSTVNKKQ
jgi:hypothetical protein